MFVVKRVPKSTMHKDAIAEFKPHYTIERPKQFVKIFTGELFLPQKLKAQLYRLQAEFDQTRRERDTLQATNVAQSAEIDRLKASNIKVTIQRDTVEKGVRVMKVQVKECKDKVNKLEKKLHVVETEKREVEHHARDLESQLAALVVEMQAKATEHEDLIAELKNIIKDLEERLGDSKNRNRMLESSITGYLAEIDKLKAQFSSDKRFFQFVTVKREVDVLKDQNVELKTKLIDQETLIPVPVMKKSGKISLKGSRVKSADIRRAFGTSTDSKAIVRCASARLHPPSPMEHLLKTEGCQ